MQYDFATRKEYVKSIEFSNLNPIENIQKILYFKEYNLTGEFINKQYRYSYDNVVWSNWNTLSQNNLSSIPFKNNPDFYLQIKYLRQGIGSGNIQKWYLIYDASSGSTPTPIDSSIDADYFAGQLPSYYLNVQNHYGPYTSIILENILDPSGLGTYYSRTDTSAGTTFKLRSIKGDKGITLSDQAGVIIIDGSLLQNDINVLDISINALYNELDIIDVSILDIYSKINYLDASIATRDTSINELYNWNNIQDASIIRIDGSLNVISDRLDSDDSSIIEIKTDLANIEASIVRIDNEQLIQDSSISNLRSNLLISDSSILLNTSSNIIQDASILKLDASQNIIFPKVIANESSIELITEDVSLIINSINSLTSWNTTQDNSIILISNTLNIVESSAGNLSDWNIIQDVSIISLRSRINNLDSSIIRIDSSLNSIFATLSELDTSIEHNTEVNDSQDASIIRIDNEQSIQDASIVLLRTSILNNDASIQRIDSNINDIYIDISTIDSSIVGLRSRLNIVDSSLTHLNTQNLAQDASIIVLRNVNESQDASIVEIKFNLDIIEASIAALEDNEILIVGDGSISVYSGTDTSGNILLKTISQIGPVIISEDSSTILIDSSIVKKYDTTLDPSIENYISVGGIRQGAVVYEYDNSTYTNILDQILFPKIDSSYIDPSIVSFERTGSQYYEVDYNASITFITTFDRGSIKINDVFQDYRSGLPTTYHYSGPGITGDVSSAALTDVLTQSIDMSIGLHTWEVYVTYEEGPQPFDSHLNVIDSSLPAGDTSIISLTAEGVHPLFATSSIAGTLTKQNLVSMLSGNNIEITLVPETGGNKQQFDIPNSWENFPTNRPLQSIETYIDFSDSFEYEGGTANQSLLYWDVSTTTHTVQGNIVDYISYTYNDVDRGTIKIRLKF